MNSKLLDVRKGEILRVNTTAIPGGPISDILVVIVVSLILGSSIFGDHALRSFYSPTQRPRI